MTLIQMGLNSPHLVLGSIANQTLSVSERHIGGSGTVALIVGDNLHTVWT